MFQVYINNLQKCESTRCYCAKKWSKKGLSASDKSAGALLSRRMQPCSRNRIPCQYRLLGFKRYSFSFFRGYLNLV